MAQKRGPTRRDVLKGAAAAASLVLLGCNDAAPGGAGGEDGGGGGPAPPDLAEPPQPPEPIAETDRFDLGVASGDAESARITLWTHHTGMAPLRLVVWQMDGDRYAVEHPGVDVTPGDGGFALVEVSGLQAGQRYRYAFFELTGGARSARSAIGRFRVAPAADALEPITLGAVACTSNGRMQFPTLEHAGARADLDGFLCLGDTAYCDGSKTREQYRRKWRENLAKAGYRAVRGATPIFASWDDHEVDNNWNPESIDAAQLAAARGALFEHQPISAGARGLDRLWRRFSFGKTVELFVLDCRGERLPSTRQSNDAIYLSRAQMDWLKQGLADSPAMWKLIANSVPIGEFPGQSALNNDAWPAYKAQRTEILEFIDQKPVSGVVWVSGDFHFGSIGRVSPNGAGANQLEILAGPGGQSGNPLHYTLGKPQFDYATGTSNYTLLRFHPDRRELQVTFIDGDGTTLTDRSYPLR
jgi:alkaline phosphatase D